MLPQSRWQRRSTRQRRSPAQIGVAPDVAEALWRQLVDEEGIGEDDVEASGLFGDPEDDVIFNGQEDDTGATDAALGPSASLARIAAATQLKNIVDATLINKAASYWRLPGLL